MSCSEPGAPDCDGLGRLVDLECVCVVMLCHTGPLPVPPKATMPNEKGPLTL